MNRDKKKVPYGYWKNKERCAAEASNYETRTAFKYGSPSAFESAYKNGWLDEICTHMKVLIHHLTNEEIINKATEYDTMTDFMESAPLYYNNAHRKGLLNEIKKYMKSLGSPEKRVIYVFEFDDNHAYIGLTMNIERRKIEHYSDKDSPVYKYIQESGLMPVFKVLTDFLPVKEAAQKENDLIEEYSKKGWHLLNKKSGGDLGNKTKKHTKKVCREIALKYNDKTEFRTKNLYFYSYISKRGWLEELCAHMTQQKKANGYWKDNKERCAKEALKYRKRIEFQKMSPAAYGAAWRGGFLDEICTHMSYNEYDPVIWTKEHCFEVADGYMTRGEFKSENPAAYKAARENGWLDEFFENKPLHGYKNERLERRYYKGKDKDNDNDSI